MLTRWTSPRELNTISALTVLSQSFNLMTLLVFCPLQQLINALLLRFFPSNFSFNISDASESTKPLNNCPAYDTSCLNVLFVKCTLSSFIFFVKYLRLMCILSKELVIF